jgi:hypothetical protein
MRSEKIPVDILTCDPNHYVRCALMIQTLDLLSPEVLEVIERREWTLRTREGLRALNAFKAKTVPTMCVDGHACFENRIPTTAEGRHLERLVSEQRGGSPPTPPVGPPRLGACRRLHMRSKGEPEPSARLPLSADRTLIYRPRLRWLGGCAKDAV